MTNNIWHTDINKLTDDEIAFVAREDELGYGMYDPVTNCIKSFRTYEFYELDEIDRYCYLHDLLTLESKLEITIKALKHILENPCIDNVIDVSYVALRKIGVLS